MTAYIYRTCLKCKCRAQIAGYVENTVPIYARSTIINGRTSLRIAGIRYEFRYRYFGDDSKDCWRPRQRWICLYCDYEWDTTEKPQSRGSK